jgi:NADH:ubiquinone oxidoreductase subunit 4 (subunit M)
MDLHLLSLGLLSPLIGAATLWLVPPLIAGRVACFFGGIPLLICLFLWFQIDPSLVSPPLFLSANWIPSIANYSLAVSGLNLPFLLVSQAVSAVALWQNKNSGSWFCSPCLLLVQAALVVALTSQDLLLFCAALGTVAMGSWLVLLIENEHPLAFSSLAFAVLEHLSLWFAALLLGTLHFFQFSFFSTEISQLRQLNLVFPAEEKISLLVNAIFAAMVLASGLRAGIFPSHFRLIRDVAQSSTATKTLRLGTDTLLALYTWVHWILPLFPHIYSQTSSALCLFFACAGLYSALLALSCRTLHEWLGAVYSAQSCFVFTGLLVLSGDTLQGAVFHGLAWSISASLFVALSDRFYRFYGTTDPYEIGSLVDKNGRTALVLGIAACLTVPLPGGPSFVSHLLILSGLLNTHPGIALVATLTCLGTICSLYRLLPPLFSGVSAFREIRVVPDLSWRAAVPALGLCLLLLIVGIYPSSLRQKMEPAIKTLWQSRLKANAPPPQFQKGRAAG